MSAEDLRRSSAQRLWILCAQIPRPLPPDICSPVQSCIRCHENPAALRVQADIRPDSVTYTTAAATNLRSGEWGGSVRNRIRFAVEVVRAIAHTIGAHRTALRISPSNPFDDMSEPRAAATHFALVEQLRPIGMAYPRVVEVGDRALTNSLRAATGKRSYSTRTPLRTPPARANCSSSRAAPPTSSPTARCFWPTPTCRDG
jgi:hypothetical protein